MIAEGGREDAGQESRDEAEQERDRYAEADQRKHVEVAGPERLPRPYEERPPAPKYDRCGEGQLRPLRTCRFDQPVEADPGHHVAHRVDEQRQGEERADPEAARHVDEFGIGSILEADRLRLQSHSADGAASRSYLPDFGMHGTGVNRPLGNVLDLHKMRARQIVLRVADELVLAPRRTEVMGCAVVLGDMRSTLDRHAHAADRVDGGSFTLGVACLMGVATAHGLPPLLRRCV